MNYINKIRNRVLPPSNHPDDSESKDDTLAPVHDEDDVYWRAIQADSKSKPRIVRHLMIGSPGPTPEWKRFKYSETTAMDDATPVTPEPSIGTRQKTLTVQTDRRTEEEEEADDDRLTPLLMRRHEYEPPNGTSPYFTDDTYLDPEEDPLECFMAYENVWWRRRPWGPSEKLRMRRSGDLF